MRRWLTKLPNSDITPNIKVESTFKSLGIFTLRSQSLFVALCRILKKLKRYGISGVLSYGLLNTAYYLCTFLVVW